MLQQMRIDNTHPLDEARIGTDDDIPYASEKFSTGTLNNTQQTKLNENNSN
jgi:hypothetical protein